MATKKSDPISTGTGEQSFEQHEQQQADNTAAHVNDLPKNPVPRDGIAPMPERDVFEEYGESVSSRNIVGQLLKFSKGDWEAGEGETFEPGKKMIVNMDELLLGWLRWEDQRPADQRMGRLVDGFVAPPRHTLGYGYDPTQDEDQTPDTAEWELDPTTHQPRDPWQQTYYLVMKDPDIKDEGEGIYTFTTSSVGGRNAIADLCKHYGRKRREHDNYKAAYPIVALKVGSYNHPNKAFGKIKTPGLATVGWAAKSVFGELPPPVDATLQIADAHKGEDIPF